MSLRHIIDFCFNLCFLYYTHITVDSYSLLLATSWSYKTPLPTYGYGIGRICENLMIIKFEIISADPTYVIVR